MSDKSELKKIRKRSELARDIASPPSIGKRFPNVYNWGYDLLTTMISIEARLKGLEDRVNAATLHLNRTIKADTNIFGTTTQTINSNAEISE